MGSVHVGIVGEGLSDGEATEMKGPARSAPVPDCAQADLPLHDLATLQTVSGLLGEDRTRTFLGKLKDLLPRLGGPGDATDRQATSKLAHSLVSLAGQLGFMRLSNAARSLEAACLSNEAIDPALAGFGKARDEALRVLNDMLGAKTRTQETAVTTRDNLAAS